MDGLIAKIAQTDTFGPCRDVPAATGASDRVHSAGRTHMEVFFFVGCFKYSGYRGNGTRAAREGMPPYAAFISTNEYVFFPPLMTTVTFTPPGMRMMSRNGLQ